MDKREFLEVLRQSLTGEVGSDVIEQNIKYYDQYISSGSLDEEARIIDMLGDPRLIARTIIDTNKIAKQKDRFNGYHNNNQYSDKYESYEEEQGQQQRSKRNNAFHTNLTWFQKLSLIAILIVVIFVLFFIGRIIIGFLFAFAVPILLIMLVFSLFKRRH